MDESLRRLAERVEEGEEIAPIWIVSGPLLLRGLPRASTTFANETERFLVDQYAAALAARPRRERKDVPVDHVEMAQRHLGVLRMELAGDLSALTLAPVECQMIGAFGYLYKMPVARVPLDSVHAWWVGGLEQIEEPKRQGGSGIGAVFPLPQS